MPFKLISTEGDQTFELREGPALVVGRAFNSDIPLFDPTISRRHAEVALERGKVLVRDLGSSNGTYVNGSRVENAHVTVGDMVTFGKVGFELREVVKEAEPPPLPMPDAPTPVAGGSTIVRQRAVRESQGLLATALRVSDEQRITIDSDQSELDRHERIEQRLALLVEVSKGLSRAVDIDALLERISSLVFEILDVDRVAIVLLDENGNLIPRISRDRRGTVLARAVPQSIARKVVEEKVAILSDNAPEDQRFTGQSIVLQSVRSAMCAPMIGSEDSVQGVLYVDNLTATQRFGDEDLDFIIAFSSIAAAAIENSKMAERIRREALVRSNFERYFAPALAARIASAPDQVKLGGTKCPVAILFSDIRGFTELSEHMRPEEVARLLSEYFSVMVDCVFRHGGTLDKFIGDAVMAQWGAPIGAPDDADRCLAAAVDMLQELKILNTRWRSEGRPELEVGIGLNFGETFAGNIGSEQRLEFTIIGDAVNVAARLCKAARGSEILLTETMRRVLTGTRPLVERDPIEAKGVSKPIAVYSLSV
jgi:adenylate cyclase